MILIYPYNKFKLYTLEKRFWFSSDTKNLVETVTEEDDDCQDYYQRNEQVNYR